MTSDRTDLFELFSSIKRSAEMSSASAHSEISMDSFFEGLSGLAVRQITNSRGETYPSDFGVGLPPLA